MTTDETVDCYNCGRSNPEWAQVCRSCGVPLRHGQARVVPTGRIPTDTNSLISIAAVIGVILGAVVLGIFLSSLNPTDPTRGRGRADADRQRHRRQPNPPPRHRARRPSRRRPRLPHSRARSRSATRSTRTGRSPIRSRRSRRRPPSPTPSRCRADSAPTRSRTRSPKSPRTAAETIVLPRQGVPVDPAATAFGYVVGTAGDFLGRGGRVSSSGASTSTDPSPRAAGSATPRAS